MLSALVGLLVVGVVGLVLLTVIVAIIGAVFGLAVGLITLTLTLAFKILPVVLVGWLVVKLLQRSGSRGPRSRLSAEDRRWLDG